jgi:hypothetical protein
MLFFARSFGEKKRLFGNIVEVAEWSNSFT